jgi:hypothetical protein
MSRFFGGAALAAHGDAKNGLSAMLPALVEHRETVGSHVCGIMLGFIATAYGQAEQWEEGLQRVDEGIELGEGRAARCRRELAQRSRIMRLTRSSACWPIRHQLRGQRPH